MAILRVFGKRSVELAGDEAIKYNRRGHSVSELAERHFCKYGRLVPRPGVELSTACEPIIANENRLSAESNIIGEERERYRRKSNESVAKNGNYKQQDKKLTI